MILLAWVILVTWPKAFCYGLGLTSIASGLSYVLARWCFGNIFYLAQLLPAFMVLYILVAWLMYLRKTGLLAFGPQQKPSRAMGYPDSEHTQDLPEDKISGRELILTRDPDGLVRPRVPQSPPENPIPVLLWSALQIAFLSIYLYEACGIGARFHL
jgi:hypothetical protein